jgi:SAM-dependent methyltransferase
VDLSPHSLALAKQNLKACPNATFALTTRFARASTFDLIYSLHVLQHNTPPEQQAIVRQIKAALKPDGLACLHLPAPYPGYEPIETCVCFTHEQARAIASIFSAYGIQPEEPGELPAFWIWARP